MNRLKRFLKERPATSLKGICKEAGVDYTSVHRALKGERPWRESYNEKFTAVMKKYGYEDEMN